MVKSNRHGTGEEELLDPDLELRVEADRAEGCVLIEDRIGLHLAVVAAGGGEHEVGHAVPIAELEQAPRAVPDRPGGELGLRLAGRVADDRGEMDYRIEPLAREQRLEVRGDADVDLAEREVRVGEQVEQRLAAEQERVCHDDAVAPGQQLAGDHRADIAGTAGDKDRAHEFVPSPIATPRQSTSPHTSRRAAGTLGARSVIAVDALRMARDDARKPRTGGVRLAGARPGPHDEA